MESPSFSASMAHDGSIDELASNYGLVFPWWIAVVVGVRNLPSSVPVHASSLYARNINADRRLADKRLLVQRWHLFQLLPGTAAVRARSWLTSTR